jgi:opacity protein-like surface antigen
MNIKINFSHFVHWSALMLLPCLLLPGAVNAQEKAALDQIRITPFLGYRVGGEFNDFTSGTTLELDDAQSYGLIFSKGAEDALEFSISVQPTQLSVSGNGSSTNLFDVDVFNYMLGGKKILNRESGGFVSGLVGVTHFDPSESGLSSETRFALGIGGGIDYPIANNLSFRLEGRGIGTFLNSSGGIFCGSNSGCALYADSSLLLQFEIISGLTFRF